MNLIAIVERLFEQYGYLVLLIGLPLDFIALPIPPGNSTLTYTGYLSYKGVLQGGPAIAMALSGAIIGVTITYVLGYALGMPLIERFGKWLLLKPAHIEKTRRYYDKYGNRLLLVGFFIPGVRQFIGYFIGIIRVPYRTVAIYAYTGTLLWVLAFWGIGYFFGDQWEHMLGLVERYLKFFFIGVGALLVALVLIRLLRRARI
ncbi:DedA family protein [Cohnella nanjingensis]|uniref:DedA family protein n=1 Tax=Cohnella nanjingensis TaxID=1387779 RepID=A0A7X0VIR4_9BACL|nr:DedA family protein [Cohnella nanjingensis]MBB6675206.1 DedA family protein [Cohnella nanjingensis]